MEVARDTNSFAVPPCVRNVKHCEQVPRNDYARYELRERCLRSDGGVPDDCSGERPVAPLGKSLG
jgi:hypothetical protein